jgi:hypothetical protein
MFEMYEGQIMEPRELSALQSQTVEAIPSIFPGRTWPGAVVGSFIAVSDDWRLDHRALLRWADDGGRWVEEAQGTLQEVEL